MKPVPAKYPYPYAGSQVLKGTGQGHPKMTLGLPVLITSAWKSGLVIGPPVALTETKTG